MLKKIPFSTAVRFMLVIYTFLILNQLFIMFGIMPFDINFSVEYWDSSIIIPFLISIAIFNVLPMLAVAIKGGKSRIKLPMGLVNSIIWIASVLFLINAVTSFAYFEITSMLVYAPIALISGVLCLRIAQESTEPMPRE